MRLTWLTQLRPGLQNMSLLAPSSPLFACLLDDCSGLYPSDPETHELPLLGSVIVHKSCSMVKRRMNLEFL